jgi:hypothetical protein
MSTAIIARSYFKESYPPMDEIFCRMVRTIDEWPQAGKVWNEFSVFKQNQHTESIHQAGPLSLEQIRHAVAGRHNTEELLSTTTWFRCWRFHTGTPEPGSVVAWVDSWGEDWGKRNYEDRRLGGEAAFAVSNCGPFCALIDDSKSVNREQINARVEENLDALTGILFRLIEVLEPWSMKVFTDQGLYLPFNAHLSYYS